MLLTISLEIVLMLDGGSVSCSCSLVVVVIVDVDVVVVVDVAVSSRVSSLHQSEASTMTISEQSQQRHFPCSVFPAKHRALTLVYSRQ